MPGTLGLGSSPETAGSASSIEELQGAATGYGPYFLFGAAIAFACFIYIETHVVKYPLVRLGMFRSRNFSASSSANFLVGFCLAISLVSAPLLVNFRVKNPTSSDIQNAAYVAGLLLSGLTVPMALAAIPGGWLSERYGYRMPTAIGLALASGGFALAGIVWENDTSYWIMGAQMAVIGVGLGLTISPIGTAVINDVDESERGVAAALILILRLVGMTVAISWLTIFSLHRFDTLVSQYVIPATASFEETVKASQQANLNAIADVISELQFIGAGASGLALLVAMLLHGGRNPDVIHKSRQSSQTAPGK